MIDINKKYTYNGKPVRIYADGSDTWHNTIHGAINYRDGWQQSSFNESDLVEVWEPKEGMISMTKEELLAKVNVASRGDKYLLLSDIEEFFKSNVVIPRGENRHPYADVLHEWAEGDILQCKEHGAWIDVGTDDRPYRIKPSEPVYEFLWQYPSCDFEATTDNYLTQEEVDKLGIQFWCKTETKRVRQ